MSSFLKQGLKKSQHKKKKEVKKRVKAMYNIMNELDDVARDIALNEEETITEDNLVDIASNYTDREIEGFEKLILLSKLEGLGKINKENILKDEK